MKLPSIQYLIDQAGRSATRFPMTLISASIGVLIALWLTEYEATISNPFPYINGMLSAALGIPLFFCISIYSERSKLEAKYLWIFRLVAISLLVALYFSFPNDSITSNISLPYIRYTIYNVVVHLLVACIPFLKKGQINGFWQYNKVLFLRILESMLYSSVLHTGLSLAIWSLKVLFEIDIDEKWFLRTFIVIAGIFNTWFFLSGIPKDIHQLDDNKDYPKSLKIFSQYVLLSLLTVYMVILYAYSAMILVQWDWPKGIVTYLIIAMAVVGILALLLIFPYAKKEENRWIITFSKWFYILLVPLLVVLYLAIGMRIGDYGVTINRYIVVTIGVWLTFITVMFIVGRATIKTIPISLGIIGLLVSFGPWGMFSVSENSQVSRLKNILTEKEILSSEKISNEVQWIPDTSEYYNYQYGNGKAGNDNLLTDSLHNEVKSILNYLDNHHGFRSIDGWFTQNTRKDIRELANLMKYEKGFLINEADIYMEKMGLSYRYFYSSPPHQKYFNFYLKKSDKIHDIKNYRYIIDIGTENYEKNNFEYKLDSIKYNFEIDKMSIILKENGLVLHKFDASHFEKMLTARSHSTLRKDKMTLKSDSSTMLIMNSIDFKKENNKTKITNFSGLLLIK